MAVCLGAAVDVSASSQRVRAERVGSFTAEQRDALASLLACLSDTRKQRLAEQQAHRLNLTLAPRRIVDAPLDQPTHRLTADADPLGPGVLARSHLLNLPPPR
ncbi:hypothetical protein ACERK3_01200 [Phycisphaerales bacterium AB-hyl4]|uniref:Transposase n=1 Tax=Natronomicrosphaera hydrolytica TaxID=3242702 RepID=A0ABV4TZY8_9BACT